MTVRKKLFTELSTAGGNIVISISLNRFADKRYMCVRPAHVEISMDIAICKFMVYWQKCMRIFHI